MIICPAPIMPRNSPMFLEVPKALPHRRARSRSRPREPESPGRRTRSRSRGSPTRVAPTPTNLKSTSPTRGHRRLLSSGGGRRSIGSPPPLRTSSPKTLPLRKKTPPPHLLLHKADPEPVHPREIFNDLNGDFYTLPPSPSPPPTPKLPLRERLIGAWKLESYIAYPTASSPLQRAKYPMTKNVTGLIMYTPDGYMSAQMLIPGQQQFNKGPGDDSQWAEAGKRCFAYCGPYFISNDGPGNEEVLRHSFQFCSLPGWIGDIQIRTWRFEEDGDVLVLGSQEPTEVKGDFRIPVLKWRKCRDNSGGTPPPPVPQIKVSGPGEP
ncbi:Lipocalin-like domain-containing protein [Elsinoe ampelina]|uniref:Lipocalin-like domain-containing protein n=1 Tax=Elsinoe ampelina TaxID=302913 RepID=A0A6A6GQW6_9PEZI|nr:Lipocalin-like domain-containing protein [Elsinoe ampelina]